MRVLAAGESLLWMSHNGGDCVIRRGPLSGDGEPETRARLGDGCAGLVRVEEGLVAATTEAVFLLDEGGEVRRRRPVEPPGPMYDLEAVAGRPVVLTAAGRYLVRDDGYVRLTAIRGAVLAGDDDHYFVGHGARVDRCDWSSQDCERATELESPLQVGGLRVHDGRLLVAVHPPHRSDDGQGGVGWLDGSRFRWLVRGAFRPTGLFVHQGHIYFSGRQGYLRRVPLSGGEAVDVTSISVALLPGRVAPVGDRLFFAGGPHSDRLFYTTLTPD